MNPVTMPAPAHATSVQRGFRCERKYYLTPGDALTLRQRVAWLLRPDTHAQNGPYHISSLYFDDVYDTALHQKLCGALVRDKWRLRWYDGATEKARLERKHKYGDFSRKDQAWLRPEQFRRLCRGDFGCAAGEEASVWRAFYAAWLRTGLRPVVRVDYDREAFSHAPGNVRVTFDSGLRAARPGSAVLLPVQTDGLTILELKYDGFLPDAVARLFADTEMRQLAISKYVMARFCLMQHAVPSLPLGGGGRERYKAHPDWHFCLSAPLASTGDMRRGMPCPPVESYRNFGKPVVSARP